MNVATPSSAKLKPYEYQERGIDWLQSLPRAGILADDMGLGKTLQTIFACERSHMKRVLVVTLNSTRRVWRNELQKCAPDAKFVVIDAWEMTDTQRKTAILDKTNRYVIVNYQMMLKLVGTLERVYWDVVIFDEAHKLKNRASQTHKASRRLTRKSSTRRVWFCTGTPVENHLEEYWPYLRVCDAEFGSYWTYVERYANVEDVINPKTGITYGKIVNNPDSSDPRLSVLVNKIRPFVLRRTKEDVFPEMPRKTYTRVPLQMNRDERRMYDQMLKRMFVKLPDGREIACDSELAQATRLLQLSVDWQILLGDYECRQRELSGTKAEILLENLEQLNGRPFVLFSQWSRVIDLVGNLLAKHGITFFPYTGHNVGVRENRLDEWNAGQAQGLLVTIQAGGTGLDFTRASDAFFLDRSWNPKQNEQAEDRLHRHGQTRPVIIKDFYFEATREETLMDVLDGKIEISDAVVGVLEE